MPRPPSVKHPLRTARLILGLSQPEFGAKVGVSGVTIQQIENHVMKMSLGLAQKISIAYGLDPDQLMTGARPMHPMFSKFVGEEGVPFTREGYEALRKGSPRDLERRNIDSHVSNFTFALQALLDAANHGRMLGPFSNALTRQLSTLVDEFGLRGRLEELFKHYGADPDRRDFNTILFRGPQIEGLVENRDRMRPWCYDELATKPTPEPVGEIIPQRMSIAQLLVPSFADRNEESPRPPKPKTPRKPRKRTP
jgi:transcriptional regulator with XRE-family HTH domain